MGKKLTSWERSQRQAEKDRARSRAAAARQTERQERMKEREQERAKVKTERQAERDRIRKEKQAERETELDRKLDRISVWKKEVDIYESYIHNITNLDKLYEYDPKDYENRLSARTYIKNEYEPLPIKKKFIPGKYKPSKKFKPKEFKEKNFFSAAGNYLVDLPLERNLKKFIRILVLSFIILLSLGPLMVAGPVLIAGYYFFIKRKIKPIKENHKTKFEDDEKNRKLRFEKDVNKKKQAFEEKEAKRKSEYEKEKQEFLDSQLERKAEYEKIEQENAELFKQNDISRLEILNNAKDGDTESIALITEALLPIEYDIDLPSDFIDSVALEHEIAYNVIDPKNIAIVIHISDKEEIIPSSRIEMTPAGTKIKYSNVSDKEQDELYESYLASMIIGNSKALFTAVPFIDKISFEICAIGVDESTGKDIENVLIAVNIDAEKFGGLNLDRISARPALSNFSPVEKGEIAIARDEIIWATEEDEGFVLPYGLVQGQDDNTINNKYSALSIDEKWSPEHSYAYCCVLTSMIDGEATEEEPIIVKDALASLFDLDELVAIQTVTDSIKLVTDHLGSGNIVDEYEKQCKIFFSFCNELEGENKIQFKQNALTGLSEIVYADGVLDEMEDKVVSVFYREGGYSEEQLQEAIHAGEMKAALKTGNTEAIFEGLSLKIDLGKYGDTLSILKSENFPDIDFNHEYTESETGDTYTLLSHICLLSIASTDPDQIDLIKFLIENGASPDLPAGNSGRDKVNRVEGYINDDFIPTILKNKNMIKVYEILK